MKILQSFLAVSFITFILMSCSSGNPVKLNSDDIEMNILSVQSNADYRSYNIEISNRGEIEIYYLNLYVSYPIKQSNGSKSSPYKVEGSTDRGKPTNLKPNEKINFTVLTPIKEVFGESNRLEFDHPHMELNGYFKYGNKDVPFGISKGT